MPVAAKNLFLRQQYEYGNSKTRKGRIGTVVWSVHTSHAFQKMRRVQGAPNRLPWSGLTSSTAVVVRAGRTGRRKQSRAATEKITLLEIHYQDFF